MPKMKTKSSVKGRFKITATGKVRAAAAYRRHMQVNKPKKMLRQSRGTFIMEPGDANLVTRYFMPYGKKSGRA